jgi:hypothetical protein
MSVIVAYPSAGPHGVTSSMASSILGWHVHLYIFLQSFYNVLFDHSPLDGLTRRCPSHGSWEACLTDRSGRQDLFVIRAHVVCGVAAMSEHGYD